MYYDAFEDRFGSLAREKLVFLITVILLNKTLLMNGK